MRNRRRLGCDFTVLAGLLNVLPAVSPCSSLGSTVDDNTAESLAEIVWKESLWNKGASRSVVGIVPDIKRLAERHFENGQTSADMATG